MKKSFSMSMFANAEDLYKAKAEYYQKKYEATHSLMIDLQATLRAIKNSSNAMMAQSEEMREIIDNG